MMIDKLGFDARQPFVNDKPQRKLDYVEYMTDRLFTMFEWRGLPETIPAYVLERLLQWNGNACIFEHEGQLYATFGGLGGELDYNYEPTLYVIANPYLNYSAELKIGTECVRMRNDAIGKGLLPLHFRYADIMVENDITLRIMDIIRRIDHGIIADNDQSFESAKEFLSDIERGLLSPIMSEEFFEGVKAIETSKAGTLTDLIELQQYLKASWFNELGLNSNYNMKRERIAAPEAQMSDDALLPLAEHMLEMRKRGCEMVNEMFGTEWEVDFSGAWKREDAKQQLENVDNVDTIVDNSNDSNSDTGDTGDGDTIENNVDIVVNIIGDSDNIGDMDDVTETEDNADETKTY